MLSRITWEQYATWVALLTGGYYIVVVLLYYRRDMWQLAQGRKPGTTSSEVLKGQPTRKEETTFIRPGMPGTLIHQVHDLMEELKPVFADAPNLLGKGDLLARVQTRLHGYIPLKGSEFEDAVIHHIILESNEQCGIALHAEEIKQYWS